MKTAIATDDGELERRRLLWRLRVNMLLLMGTKSETEVSEWIRAWLKNWEPPK